MRSPTYALIWEQWRQVRIPITFSLILTAIASWTLRQVMEMSLGPHRKWLPVDSEDWGMASSVLVGISMILVMAALIFAHSSTRDLRMGLPLRLLTLPVASYRLATTQIIFRLVIVALVALAIGLSLSMIDPWYEKMIAPLVGMSVLCYSYISLVATTIGKRSPVIAFVVLAFTISPVVVSVTEFARSLPQHEGSRSEAFGATLIVSGAFIAVCLALSIYRFATLRTTSPVQVLLLTRQVKPELRYRHAEDTAQYKFEWRRVAWLYPSVMAGIALMFVMPSFFAGPRIQGFDQIMFMASITAPTLSAFIVGMILMAREHRDNVTGVARFLWTRPLPVQQVVLYRMKAAAVSILCTHAIILALALLVALIEGELTSIRLGAVFFGLASVSVLLAGIWSLVWVPYLPVLYWLVFLVYWGSTFVTDWGRKEDFYLLWAPATLFWIAVLGLGAACYRRRIFESRVIARFIVFCLALAFVTISVYYVGFYRPNSVWKPSQAVPAAITLSALPLFALLWQGFFLDRVRHNALFRRLPARDS